MRTTGLALQRAPDRGTASRPVGETREGALHRATESSCRESPFVKKPESNDSGSGADNRTCKDERSKDGIAERCDASRIRTVMMWDKRGNEPKKQKNKRRCNSLVFLAQKASFPKVVRTTGLALQRAPDRGTASRSVGETREGALHRATESSCRESPFVKKPESNDSGSGADNRT